MKIYIQLDVYKIANVVAVDYNAYNQVFYGLAEFYFPAMLKCVQLEPALLLKKKDHVYRDKEHHNYSNGKSIIIV